MAEPAFRTQTERVEDVPDATTIHLEGRATLEDAAGLRESLLAEVSATPSAKIVLELSRVEDMDTAGAAVLVEALALGHRRGRRMLLCSPSESVVRRFRLAGFEEVLDYTCATPDETRRRLLE